MKSYGFIAASPLPIQIGRSVKLISPTGARTHNKTELGTAIFVTSFCILVYYKII